MNLEATIDRLNTQNLVPGDYTGPDGLLYCGKCHTPKQTRGTGLFDGKLLTIMCHCKEIELNDESEKAKRQRIEELREHCLPTEAMRKHTFQNATGEKHILTAKRYVQKWEKIRAENIGLLLWGNTGTGKSFTAQCIANALIDHEIPVFYISAVDIVSSLMGKENNRDQLLKRVRDVPLFVLDDVGAERDTAFSREQLCSIIDTRAEAGKPLIITTNYTLSELKDTRNDQALQRLFNRITACCVPVAVTGASKRDAIGDRKLSQAREILEL